MDFGWVKGIGLLGRIAAGRLWMIGGLWIDGVRCAGAFVDAGSVLGNEGCSVSGWILVTVFG